MFSVFWYFVFCFIKNKITAGYKPLPPIMGHNLHFENQSWDKTSGLEELPAWVLNS